MNPALWLVIFGFLPAWIVRLVLAYIALLVIMVVLRVVAKILDAIPFL